MTVIYSYLFEARSIQQYLFRTGRLKDTIAASERLDRMVNDNQHCLLYHVLAESGLNSHNLLAQDSSKTDTKILFTRCKSGQFCALSKHGELLVKLRSVWTLTLPQLFPGLAFADGMGQGTTVNEAIATGRQSVAQNRQLPVVGFPIGTAIMRRTNRTGLPSVMRSVPDAQEREWDADMDMMRQAYRGWKLADKPEGDEQRTISTGSDKAAKLQQRFTPEGLTVSYPTNFEEEDGDFWFSDKGKDADKDIAMIHIDGNGLGDLVGELEKTVGKTDDLALYAHVMRTFSSQLAEATESSAKEATGLLFDKARYQLEGRTDRPYIPMRPLVLGGDDITVLCHPAYALDFACCFCKAFRSTSESLLKDLHSDFLRHNTAIKGYLTASGGILFHKSGHAFTHSYRLVEDLTRAAKNLTKRINPVAGPAALSFFRLSSTATSEFSEVRARFQQFEFDGDTQSEPLTLGLDAYLVEPGEKPSVPELLQCFELAVKAPLTIGKWRQMASHIALGDSAEAARIFDRTNLRDLPSEQQQALKAFKTYFSQFAKVDEQNVKGWYWRDEKGKWQTILSDLFVLHKLNELKKQHESRQKEAQA